MSMDHDGDDRARITGQFGIIRQDEMLYIAQHLTFASLAMFTKITLHTNKFGECLVPKAYLIRTSELSKSTAYEGFSKLLELGIISHIPGGYYINPVEQWIVPGPAGPDSGGPSNQNSGGAEIETSGVADIDSALPTTYPYSNKLHNRDEEKTRKRGEKKLTRVSNVSRNTPPLGRSRNAQHTRSSSNITQPSPNKAAAVDVASSKIHELSGIWITDSHKFDTATPHLTREEWLPFILEAWELKDTVLQSEKYPEFNAAKVINYAKHRAAYRKKMPKTGPGPALDYSTELARTLTEVNDVRRFQQLQNYVMFGMPRKCVQGRISSEELAQLYPSPEDPVDSEQGEHSADVHSARV